MKRARMDSVEIRRRCGEAVGSCDLQSPEACRPYRYGNPAGAASAEYWWVDDAWIREIRACQLRRACQDLLLAAAAGPASNVILVVIAELLPHGLYGLRSTFRPGRGGVCETPREGNFRFIIQYVSYLVVGLRPRSRGGQPTLLGIRLTRLERQGFLIILGSFLVVPYAVEQFGMYIISFDGWWGRRRSILCRPSSAAWDCCRGAIISHGTAHV